MTDNELTYMINVPAAKLDIFTETMANIGVDFSPKGNLVEIGYMPEDAIYLTGDEARSLVGDINDFLQGRNWEPKVPEYNDDWTPERIWALMQFASQSMPWEGGQIDRLHWYETQEGWQRLTEGRPEIFG